MDTILTLPLVLAVVLVELALGGTFVSWFLERRGEAPGGFLKLVAGVDALAAAAAVGLAPALPRGDAAAKIGLDAGPLSSFGQSLALVAILMTAQLVFTFVPAKTLRNVGALLAMAAGLLALGVATVARPTQAPYDVFALLAPPLGALALGGIGLVGMRALADAGPWGLYVLLWLILPPLLALLGAWFTGIAYNVRYAIVSLPAFVLTIAFGIARRPRTLAVGWLAAVAIVTVLSVGRDRVDPGYAREDMRAAGRYLTGMARAGERIVIAAEYIEPAIAHYYHGPAQLGELPSRPIRTEAEATALIEQLQHDGPATWLVLSRDWDDDPAGLLRQALGTTAPRAHAVNFPGVDIYRLGS